MCSIWFCVKLSNNIPQYKTQKKNQQTNTHTQLSIYKLHQEWKKKKYKITKLPENQQENGISNFLSICLLFPKRHSRAQILRTWETWKRDFCLHDKLMRVYFHKDKICILMKCILTSSIFTYFEFYWFIYFFFFHFIFEPKFFFVFFFWKFEIDFIVLFP